MLSGSRDGRVSLMFRLESNRSTRWLRERGFVVLADHADRALAARYFRPELAHAFPDRGGHVALCAPIEAPSGEK
jgi:hypothetical protein